MFSSFSCVNKIVATGTHLHHAEVELRISRVQVFNYLPNGILLVALYEVTAGRRFEDVASVRLAFGKNYPHLNAPKFSHQFPLNS
jgi:hypothetical protein